MIRGSYVERADEGIAGHLIPRAPPVWFTGPPAHGWLVQSIVSDAIIAAYDFSLKSIAERPSPGTGARGPPAASRQSWSCFTCPVSLGLVGCNCVGEGTKVILMWAAPQHAR